MVTSVVLLNIPPTTFAGTFFGCVEYKLHGCSSSLLLFLSPLGAINAIIILLASFSMMPLAFMANAGLEITSKTAHDRSVGSIDVNLSGFTAWSKTPPKVWNGAQRRSCHHLIVSFVKVSVILLIEKMPW